MGKPTKGSGEAMKALVEADQRVSFGPLFFMQNLRGLVRDRCPEADKSIPSVQIHLMDGEILDICHIIGVAPNWIALAVHEEDHPERPSQMRTEMVPFHLIARVSIQTNRHEGSHPIGFNTGLEPELYGTTHSLSGMTPEDALKAVAGIPALGAPRAGDVAPTGSKKSR